MTYTLDVSEHLDRIFAKLSKKDKLQFEILTRKINEILVNPQIGEPLTGNMAGQRSVHVKKTLSSFLDAQKCEFCKHF